jgi:hypothetical protein
VIVLQSNKVPDLVGLILLKTGAVSDDTAAPLVELNGHERRQLAALLKAGVISEARGGGRYYVDRDKLEARAAVRLRVLLAVVVLALALGVVVAIYVK